MTMRRAMRHIAGGLAFAAALAVPSFAQQASDNVVPEPATGAETKQAVTASRHMVVAANPLAAQAGLDVLRKGGSAADALVTVQSVLGLVEPQSSGLGGGAFLVWYDAATGLVTTFDGRETAPAAATEALFLDGDGNPLPFFEAVVGGRSVGAPGVPRLMETIHRRAGRLDWAELFEPATMLARDGFDVSPRLAALISEDADRLGGEPAARTYFFDEDGKPLTEGARLTNLAYAETLETIAAGGANAFYEGPIADAIIAAVSGHVDNPGALSPDDLASYRVVERDPVCAVYRGFDVCGMGPPSSGALTVGQILGLVEPFDLATLGPDDPQSWRIVGDATRLAFADRNRYIADTDHVDMPKGLLDRPYLNDRSALLRRDNALPPEAVEAGEPPWDKAQLRQDGESHAQPATSHFVIVDDAGNIASMTSSIENAFGSRQMAAGFLLNNQLTDFSFLPHGPQGAIANRVEPGKRPRSSMSPTIVLRDGKPVFALGSPGGATIIPYVANAVIALIDWKLDIQQAVSMPHAVNAFGPYLLEAGTSAAGRAADLEALGYDSREVDLNSGLHGIALVDGVIVGGADPRREGVALGD
jgi:gamma-glutamyltranspeptidase/glutathione hydrolase